MVINMTTIYISCISGIILLLIALIALLMIIVNYKESTKRQTYVEKHEAYTKVLEYYMIRAFDLIYKDRILVYSIEGTKPSPEELKQHSIDFAKLTLRMLGSNLVKEFSYLYGDLDSLMFIIMEYFNTRSEHDEIKQASMDQIMEGGQHEII